MVNSGHAAGFGRDLAKHLTVRNADKLSDFAYNRRSLQLKQNVTYPSRVDAAVKAAEDYCERIDMLVNNPDIGNFTTVKASKDAHIRKMFEAHLVRYGSNFAACVLVVRRAEYLKTEQRKAA